MRDFAMKSKSKICAKMGALVQMVAWDFCDKIALRFAQIWRESDAGF